MTFFHATCHTNLQFSAKLSIIGQSFQKRKVDLGIDLDFLFLHISYWTHLELFQSKNVQKFPYFFLSLNVWKSITRKVCIFEQTFLKIKVDPCTIFKFLFLHNSYWTCSDLFQRVLVDKTMKVTLKLSHFSCPTFHTNLPISSKLSIFQQSFQERKVDSCMDLDFLFRHNSYWTHLDLFQIENVQKFPNFFLSLNVYQWNTWKVCIFGDTFLKIKVDPSTILQFQFQVNSYWKCLDLFHRV